jgi:hypothetical protein
VVPDALSGGPPVSAYCERYIRHTKGRWAEGLETGVSAQLVWILAPRVPEPEGGDLIAACRSDPAAPSGLGDPLNEVGHGRLDACAIQGPTRQVRCHREAE